MLDHKKTAPRPKPINISALVPPGKTLEGKPLTCAIPKAIAVRRPAKSALPPFCCIAEMQRARQNSSTKAPTIKIAIHSEEEPCKKYSLVAAAGGHKREIARRMPRSAMPNPKPEPRITNHDREWDAIGTMCQKLLPARMRRTSNKIAKRTRMRGRPSRSILAFASGGRADFEYRKT